MPNVLKEKEAWWSIAASLSGVRDGALAENENDFGAFCTRKTAFCQQSLIICC